MSEYEPSATDDIGVLYQHLKWLQERPWRFWPEMRAAITNVARIEHRVSVIETRDAAQRDMIARQSNSIARLGEQVALLEAAACVPGRRGLARLQPGWVARLRRLAGR